MSWKIPSESTTPLSMRSSSSPTVARPTAGALQAHCATLVPRYMVPETITFQPSLPKTSTGKIDRPRLAAEMEA